MAINQVSWEKFIVTNNDANGIHYKFEDLCRQLFKNEILSNNKKVFLHSNPNNPGIEVEPVLEKESNKYISFQAKFFENNVDYKQIEDSADKIVKHYKDKLDIVYLFCNKPLSKKCASFKRIEDKLNAAGIELVLITDTAILDIVKEHTVIANYYFNYYLITQEKLVEKTKATVDVIGERFNPNLNVETDTSKNLSIFLNNNKAIEYFNNKKTEIVEKIDSLSWGIRTYNKFASKLKECILNIPDVSVESINDVKDWDKSINQSLKKEIEEIQESITTLEKDYNETKDSKKKRELYQEINDLKRLLELSFGLKISEIGSEMLDNKILIVRGEAGVGKTQLFANEAISLINEGENSLFLIGGEFLSQDPFLQQLKQSLDIDFSFEDIIDYLELLGEKRGRIIPIFIDALNESWDAELWKSTLSSLYRKIINKNYVRLAISFRSEYQKIILPDNYSEKKGVSIITHRGFRENPIEATKKFFNHYGIAFTPVHMFDRNLDNPLFLYLYCKTYEGDEVDLATLYDRIIEKANKQIHKSMVSAIDSQGFDKTESIVLPIIEEISKYSLETGEKSFKKSKIEAAIKNNPFGLNARALITNLIKENILCDQVIDGEKYVFFAFDQMNDYFSAKTIFSQLRTEEEIIDCLMCKVLYDDKGKYTGRRKKGLFVNVCNLYANTFNKECIDIIEKIENQDEQHYLFNAYIDSLKWRSNIYMSITDIMKLCEYHRTERDLLWDVFINNSLKRNHFMNAKGLHNVLFEYSLPNRDYLWTIYINELTSEEDRLVQLIEAIRKKEIDFDTEQVKLLLVLLSWILTSSNRWLRDVTSKAIVELLKNNFTYSKWLLETFSGVNDPYIIQRLYGVVFGASVKRNSECKEDFESLVNFVFEEIFESDSVYPDILLRDYARLIIERYNYEYPKEIESKKFEKIIPPYKSDGIPEIDDEKYLDKKWDKGLYYILKSMRFDGLGMYGDFGRYIFQSALQYFDVDEYSIFNYSIYYILNELGYDNKLFDDYDDMVSGFSWDRFNLIKIERIGKKYQWIAMHNILARVSDYYQMKKDFLMEDEPIDYEGPWNPFVRDFDPTLDYCDYKCEETTSFSEINEHIQQVSQTLHEKREDPSFDEKKWIKQKPELFAYHKDDLIIKDEKGRSWVSLTKYEEIDDGVKESDGINTWSWLYGYFVTNEQLLYLKNKADNKDSLLTNEITTIPDTYYLFNREYPWSSANYLVLENQWRNINTNTASEEGISLSNNKVLCTTQYLSWEKQYDASNEAGVSLFHPCADFINEFNLQQKDKDGIYYNNENEKVAFDSTLINRKAGLVVRKDFLDTFLDNNEYKLVWFVNASKEIYYERPFSGLFSDWIGLLEYTDSKIKGEYYEK